MAITGKWLCHKQCWLTTFMADKESGQPDHAHAGVLRTLMCSMLPSAVEFALS